MELGRGWGRGSSTQLVFSHPQEPLQGPVLDFGAAGEVLHDLCRGQDSAGRPWLKAHL